MRRTNTPEHVWLRVANIGSDGCWEWQGGRDYDGYGIIGIAGRQFRTHRVAWELANSAKLGPKDFVCHTCDNPPCCNPSHLVRASARFNARDRSGKGRNNSATGERHGLRRHPERIARGVHQGQAKLNDAAVRQIRERYADGGISMKRLGHEFGITPETVHGIVHRRYWTHVA